MQVCSGLVRGPMVEARTGRQIEAVNDKIVRGIRSCAIW